MRRLLAAVFGSVLATAGSLVMLASPASALPVSVPFTYTGGVQSWVVPAGVHDLTVELYGAQGGGSNYETTSGGGGFSFGGSGGRTVSFLAVTPGETLRIVVGGQGRAGSDGGAGGFNGGGNGVVNDVDEFLQGFSGGGGGASDIRQAGIQLVHRVAVAGGGGGAPASGPLLGPGSFDLVNTGNGGGFAGDEGIESTGSGFPTDENIGGGGGTQTGGGAGGDACGTEGVSDGADGLAGVGGAGAAGSQGAAGGGGGGGYFGGGGGGATGCSGPPKFAGGGGGGSGYDSTGFGSTSFSTHGGDGLVTITYTPSPPGPPQNVSAVAGDGQATVSFSPPVDSGSSPITGYLAVCGNPDGGPSNTGSSSPIVVTGLTNGVTVTCIVQAVSAAGQGPQSEPSNPVTPTAPGPPQIVPRSVTIAEGNSGTKVALVPVSLSTASSQTVTARWDTANYQATAPADFVAASGTVSFAPGQTQKTVPVTIKGDLLDEIDETLLVRFSNPTNATIGGFGGLGAVKITDDDPLPQIVPRGASLTEGDSGTKVLRVPVTLSAPSGRTVTASWTTRNDQATAPSDFVGASGTVSFAPGQTQKTVAVTIKGDTMHEPNERFFVAFSNPTNATLGGIYGLGFATILNDD